MQIAPMRFALLFLATAGLLYGCDGASSSPSQTQTESEQMATAEVNAVPALDRLLQTLDAGRATLGDGGFRWQFTNERFTVPLPRTDDYVAALEERAANPFDGATKDEHELFVGHITWQPSVRRFLLSADRVAKWHGGAAEYYGVREQIGFDGKTFQDFQWFRQESLPPALWRTENSKPTAGLPVDGVAQKQDSAPSSPIGTIADEEPAGQRIELITAASGFLFRPGCMALPLEMKWGESVEIAAYLRALKAAGREITVHEDDNRLNVSFKIPDEGGYSLGKGTMTLVFNMEQGAAVERITFMANGPGGRTYRNADYFIRNAEVSPGVWFPEEIVWGDWMNPLVTRTTISNAHPIEMLRTSDFQVEFPPNTQFLGLGGKMLIGKP